jgi:hypothetical protein
LYGTVRSVTNVYASLALCRVFPLRGWKLPSSLLEYYELHPEYQIVFPALESVSTSKKETFPFSISAQNHRRESLKKAPKIKGAKYIVYKIVLCKIVYTESHKTHNKRIKFCSGFD